MACFKTFLLFLSLCAFYAAACHGAQSPRRKFNDQGNSMEVVASRQAAYAVLNKRIQAKQDELKADGMEPATGDELQMMLDLNDRQISEYRSHAHAVGDTEAEKIFPKVN